MHTTLLLAHWISKPSNGPVMWYFSGFLSRAVSVNCYLLSFLQPSFGLSRLRLVGWTLKALFMFKIVVWSDYYRTASQTSQKSSLVVMFKAMLLFECFGKDNNWIITTIKLIRGHSITTLTRWGGRGSKNVCFCPRRGGGGQKMAKICSRIDPLQTHLLTFETPRSFLLFRRKTNTETFREVHTKTHHLDRQK